VVPSTRNFSDPRTHVDEPGDGHWCLILNAEFIILCASPSKQISVLWINKKGMSWKSRKKTEKKKKNHLSESSETFLRIQLALEWVHSELSALDFHTLSGCEN
jgi:hypothetical protein